MNSSSSGSGSNNRGSNNRGSSNPGSNFRSGYNSNKSSTTNVAAGSAGSSSTGSTAGTSTGGGYRGNNPSQGAYNSGQRSSNYQQGYGNRPSGGGYNTSTTTANPAGVNPTANATAGASGSATGSPAGTFNRRPPGAGGYNPNYNRSGTGGTGSYGNRSFGGGGSGGSYQKREFGSRRDGPPEAHRINSRISAREVRVVSESGEQLGVLTTQQALEIAQRDGFDLVEVAPQANPPVCKIMDYGKFKYREQKKEAEAKKKRTESTLKELRIRYRTDSGDLETKLKQARDFFEDGDKVKFSMRFKGREAAFIDLGVKKFDQIIERLADVASVDERSPAYGKQIHITFAPLKVVVPAKAKKPASGSPTANVSAKKSELKTSTGDANSENTSSEAKSEPESSPKLAEDQSSQE